MTCMFFEESDKVGDIFVTQLVSYLVYLIGCCEKVSLGFQNNMFINKFRTAYTKSRPDDCIKLIGRKIQHVCILPYVFVGSNMCL